ncbi:MAG: HAD family hydrolase [Candidatus Odinarchaeota archaeon]
MIKNIIFDLGNVLINFRPIEFIESFTKDSKLSENFAEKIFFSDTWVNLDRGILSWRDAKNIFQAQHPDEQLLIDFLFNNWKELLSPIKRNIQVLKYLKQEGFSIFILSNYIDEPFEYIKNKYDFFSLLDGLVVSFQEKLIKPEIQIYQILVDRYNLIPNESIFLDDHKKFLEPAKKLGIYTLLIQPQTDIKTELRKLKILL